MSNELQSQVNSFLELLTRAEGATLCDLRRILDSIISITEDLSVVPEAPDIDVSVTGGYSFSRDQIAKKFPGLGYYNCISPISKNISQGEASVGDAIDDILDIATELAEVQGVLNHVGEEDAKAQLRWSYDNHWGQHARELQLYLFALSHEI